MIKLTKFENDIIHRIAILDKRKQDCMKKDNEFTLGIL